MTRFNRYFQDNQANWDDRADTHIRSSDYGVEDFIADKNYISEVVIPDIERLGKLDQLSVVHLQCHIGIDTISLSRLGAKHCVGVDFSPRSIQYAQEIAKRCQVNTEFVQANIYDAPIALGMDTDRERFDLVYTGIGALIWLPDIKGWAQVVADLLRPQGRLLLREDSPLSMAMADTLDAGLRLELPYFEDPEPISCDEAETYTDMPKDAPPILHQTNHSWNHGIGEIINALIGAGMVIDELTEYSETAWQRFPEMVRQQNDWFRLPPEYLEIPLSYVLQAHKA